MYLTPAQVQRYIRDGHIATVRSARLSPHFTWGEAFVNVLDERLIEADSLVLLQLFITFQRMEVVRGILGHRSIRVTSAWRDARKNTAVGGVSNSRHLTGEAIDFVVDGLSPSQVQQKLDPLWFGGLGYGHTFTHLDIRPQRVRFGYG